MIIYIENLSLNRIIVGLFKSRIWIVFLKKRIKQIYFIESSLISNIFLIPMLSIFVKNINRLDFRMMDIKDSDGELVCTRIARVDILEFLKEIIKSNVYKGLISTSWKQSSVLDYVNKGVIDRGIMEDSPSRKIYILNVISWHMRKIKVNQSITFINQCPWFELYIEHAKKYGIKLIDVPNNIFSADLRGVLRRFPKIYKTMKNIGKQ